MEHPDPESSIQELLAEAGRGSSEELLPLVYTQLRRLARKRMAEERRDHTLQATALVHEAYLRVARDGDWAGRAQFFTAAAEAMRRILIDRARGRARLKRGAGRQRLTLDALDLGEEQDPASVLALDESLERLAARDGRAADVVRLRFYAGLDVEEIASVLGISPRTVKREWNFARAWLYEQLAENQE